MAPSSGRRNGRWYRSCVAHPSCAHVLRMTLGRELIWQRRLQKGVEISWTNQPLAAGSARAELALAAPAIDRLDADA